MRHVRRGGPYLRVADPHWRNPRSPEYARRRGGRWNPPGGFGVVYLNASLDVARAQIRQKLEPRRIRPEDLEPDQGSFLVHTSVPDDQYVDAVNSAGLAALGLPVTYPLDDPGTPISHAACQPIGQQAWDAGEHGIASRSAAQAAPPGGEELTFFAGNKLEREKNRAPRLVLVARRAICSTANPIMVPQVSAVSESAESVRARCGAPG